MEYLEKALQIEKQISLDVDKDKSVAILCMKSVDVYLK